jgi:sulfur carrier protein ThiS
MQEILEKKIGNFTVKELLDSLKQTDDKEVKRTLQKNGIAIKKEGDNTYLALYLSHLTAEQRHVLAKIDGVFYKHVNFSNGLFGRAMYVPYEL